MKGKRRIADSGMAGWRYKYRRGELSRWPWRLGACLSIRRISLYTEGRVRFCLAHEQDLSPLDNR